MGRWRSFTIRCVRLLAGLGLWSMAVDIRAADQHASLADVVRPAQTKIVKIYGAGGPRGLEAYQSGFLISAEGHVLTAWSYVLDTDDVNVVLDDGRHFTAKVVGADPLTEVAVLKIDVGGEALPYFDLSQAPAVDAGARVLALSNLFSIAAGKEWASVLHGVVSVVAPLEARRGAYGANYHGNVYVIDAITSNPGSAGGALTDQEGHLLGMLGKERRGESTDTWLNYALPVAAFHATVDSIVAGRFVAKDLPEAEKPDHPLTLAALGIVLVPDVVTRTPPYVDRVVPDSPAFKAGLRADDLLVTIDTQIITSCQTAAKLIEQYEQGAAVHLAVLRDGALVELTVVQDKPAADAKE
jgi:serine protease Do